MTTLSDIVSVTITRATRTVSQEGFGIPLIAGTNGPGFADDEVREYSTTTGMSDDGFISTDAEYMAAESLFSQNPRPETVKVAKLQTWVAQQWTITIDADLIADNVISVDVDGTTVAETFAVGHDETMTAFAAALQALPEIATATLDGGDNYVVTLTAAEAGVPFVVDEESVTGGASQPTIEVEISVDNVGIKDDLDAIVLEDNDWYALLIESRDEDVVKLAAEWVEANYKIFGTCSDDSDVKDGAVSTDIASVLDDAGYDRSWVFYNEDEDDWADAAFFGRCLPYAPGSITWKFWDLSGITSSVLTETESTALANKNCNWLEEVGGVDNTHNGTMASGEFIDVIRGIDWIRARMAEYIFQALVNAEKIPYTNQGIAIIEGKMRQVLDMAIDQGIVRPSPDDYNGADYYIHVPDVNDVSDNDKGNRLLPDCEWEAKLAGAVHKVTISGRVEL